MAEGFEPTRKVELNPGEMFMVADPTILMREFETIVGPVGKLGSTEDRLALMMTFSGKRNNRDENMDVTVIMDPTDGLKLLEAIESTLTHLANWIRSQQGE